MSKSKKGIAQVGYEIELNATSWVRESSIAKKLWVNFKTFTRLKEYNLDVKMSKEYYNTTIEFNFLKEEFNQNLHRNIKFFTESMIKKYSLTTYGMNPAFVWTHIHFFRSKLNSESTDKILKVVMGFILENIKDLSIYSVERIIRSHQLWGNYAIEHTIIAEILSDKLSTSFAYSGNSASRPKYRPVIHSPRSRTWKLRSTEIRLIPTEFVLNDKILILLDRLSTMKDIPNKDIPTLYNEFITHYLWQIKKNKTGTS